MKVLFLIEGKSTPSSRFRAYNYSESLRQAGIEYKIVPIPKNFLVRLVYFLPIVFYDILVIQKKVFHIWELFLLRLLARRIIYDIDDAVMFLDRNGMPDPTKVSPKRLKRFLRTVRTADHVITGNHYLAEYTRPYNSQLTIIPTPVNTRQYRVREYEDGDGQGEVIIGWIGTQGNLKYLKMLEKPLARLSAAYPHIKMRIVCDRFVDLDGIPLDKKPWRLEEEVSDLQSFDIGVMPLVDDAWTQGKCGFKILQYMGVGIPSVCSPVGVNAEIVQEGVNGYLARTEDEWVEKLSRLIEQGELRRQIGIKGRELVEAHYSLEVTFPQFAWVLEQVALGEVIVPVKPAVLHTESSDGWGGQEIRILLEAQELRKRGYDVVLVCQKNSGLSQNAQNAGVPVEHVTMRSYFDIFAIMKLRNLMRQRNFQIVNTHSSRDSWVASFASKLAGVPALIRTRHLSVPIATHLFNIVYHMPDVIITTCESTRRDMIERNRIEENAIVSIPTGVILDRFDPGYTTPNLKTELGIAQDAPVISKVAVLRSWKRHDVFLRAAQRVLAVKPEARFLIVGEGPQRKNLERMIKQMGLDEAVIMTGYRTDIPEILSITDVSCLVSDSAEGVPQAVTQSLAMGKPTVGTNVGGIPELIVDGVTGYLIPPADPLILAEKILALLNDPPKATAMGKAGRALIRERFSCEIMLKRLEALYHDVLGVKAKAATSA
jgi:glycosyltransferase involved in cell wall biosynthesis